MYDKDLVDVVTTDGVEILKLIDGDDAPWFIALEPSFNISKKRPIVSLDRTIGKLVHGVRHTWTSQIPQ